MNLQKTAELLNVEARGEPDYPIQGVRDIERLSPDQGLEEHYIYFIESLSVFKRHPKAAEGGAVLTIPALADKFRHALVAPERDVRLAFIKLLKHFDKTPVFKPGISPHAQVHPSAKIAKSAVILEGAVVMEGATIGARCTLYPNVVVAAPFTPAWSSDIIA
jgi:UDP-3-O-[3-hydroxymyristoyl] glucosamine N-acyltransferase